MQSKKKKKKKKMGRENMWVPITKQEASYSIHKNKPPPRIKSFHCYHCL